MSGYEVFDDFNSEIKTVSNVNDYLLYSDYKDETKPEPESREKKIMPRNKKENCKVCGNESVSSYPIMNMMYSPTKEKCMYGHIWVFDEFGYYEK